MPTVSVSRRYTAEDNLFPFDRFVAAQPSDEVAAGTALLVALNNSVAGDVIAIEPGTYRVTGAGNFKNDVELAAYGGVGKAPVRITGAIRLSTWTADGVTRWWTPHTPQPRDSLMRDGTYSVCEVSAVTGTNLCWDRDQVWIDGSRMIRMASIAAGEAAVGNRFFVDRGANRVYIWTNPSGREIEINKTAYFVNASTANNVKFTRLTLEQWASPLQSSGVAVSGDGWEFDRCIFRNSHASGLHLNPTVSNAWVHDCDILSNGQEGMTVGSQSSGTVYSNNIIEYCNFIGNNQEDFYMGDWEAGGFKTTSLSGGIVRHCFFDDNRGLDLWVDFGSQWTFENNTSTNAWAQSIRIEVATLCIVRNNLITRSGHNIGDHYRASHSNWATVMDTCAISISESSWVECYGNVVNDPTTNGIIVNIRGRAETHHVAVLGNTVEQRQNPIPTGTTGTSTFGTMIAGGALMQGAPSGAATYFANAVSWSMPGGSGITHTRSVDIKNNIYRVGNLSQSKLVWRNGAGGSGTTYMTPATYATLNAVDATDILV